MAGTVHPMGKRPLSFYGPDDWDGITPWQEIEQDIKKRQRTWDAIYHQMSLWQRIKVRLAGEMTEMVGTSAGMPIGEGPLLATATVIVLPQ